MPSILDLVNEYYQLERQRNSAEGLPDQPSETRYQCLRFFLEFDFAEPYTAAAAMSAEQPGEPECRTEGEQYPQEPPPSESPPPENEEECIQLNNPIEEQPVQAPAEQAPEPVQEGLRTGSRETIKYSEEAISKAMNEYLSREQETVPVRPASEFAAVAPPLPVPPPPQDLPLVEAEALMSEPPKPAGPVTIISEPRRVTVHFTDGDVKRGVVKEFVSDSPALELFNNEQTVSEQIPVAVLKVVFVMSQPGQQAPEPTVGRSVIVTFKDGRSLRGSSPDYSPSAAVFTLHPEPRQGNIEKIAVFREATDEIR